MLFVKKPLCMADLSPMCKILIERPADDTNLFISNSNMGNLFETMNEELRKVANWFKANKLSLNISKTKYSLFHSTRNRKDLPNILPPLHIDNIPVKTESTTKFLGV